MGAGGGVVRGGEGDGLAHSSCWPTRPQDAWQPNAPRFQGASGGSAGPAVARCRRKPRPPAAPRRTCTALSTSLSSLLDTNVMARPLVPKRPARPTR